MSKQRKTAKDPYRPKVDKGIPVANRRPSTMAPEAFKAARERLGLTQQELADLADTGRVTIMRMETGRARVNGCWSLILRLLQEREDLRQSLGVLQLNPQQQHNSDNQSKGEES